VSGDEWRKAVYPTSDAMPETTAISVHMPTIRRGRQPLALRPAVEETASGTFEMKTAARYAAPTVPLS
jgi:hypothetical protein